MEFFFHICCTVYISYCFLHSVCAMSHSAGLCPEPFITFAQDAEKHPAFARCSLLFSIIYFYSHSFTQMSLCAILFIQERLFYLSCILLFCDKPCNNSGYHSKNNSYDCLNQHVIPIYGVFLFQKFLKFIGLP